MTDGVRLGISGWFTPHEILYHEESRRLDEIAPEDWSNLLAHADIIHFFTRRELAVNDPFEVPELAQLIRLTRRAMRDRQVLTHAMLTDDELVDLRAALQAQGRGRR